MESLESELHRITIENCKLKASLKAATYEKEKLLDLVKNLLTALDNSEAPNNISILKSKNPAKIHSDALALRSNGGLSLV